MGIAQCCESNGNKNQIINNHHAIKNVKYFNHNRKDMTNNDFKKNNSKTDQKAKELINAHNKINQISPFRCVKSFEAHDDKIVSLIELYNGSIVSGSIDGIIKIWDINSQQCLRIFHESGKVICMLEFEPGKLLTGTDENEIHLWDINSPQKNVLHSFKGHMLWINCLVKCDKNFFASGSNDSDIKIWNWQSKQCINTLKDHNNCVISMIMLINGNLCSSSADLTIKIWDWTKGACLQTLTGHQKWIKCVCQLSNGYIISGSDDYTIKIWSNYKNIGELKGHTGSIRSLCQISDNLFASSSFDKTIKIWDINKMSIFQNLEGHQDNVIGVIFHKLGFLISYSNDHTIKIWKN